MEANSNRVNHGERGEQTILCCQHQAAEGILAIEVREKDGSSHHLYQFESCCPLLPTGMYTLLISRRSVTIRKSPGDFFGTSITGLLAEVDNRDQFCLSFSFILSS